MCSQSSGKSVKVSVPLFEHIFPSQHWQPIHFPLLAGLTQTQQSTSWFRYLRTLCYNPTYLFRFRYNSMERAFIDDLDTIYESADVISLGYDGYFVLCHDGSYIDYNLPIRKLRHKLEDRVASDPIPTVVSLGTQHPDTFFIQVKVLLAPTRSSRIANIC